jgi:glutamine synthetase
MKFRLTLFEVRHEPAGQKTIPIPTCATRNQLSLVSAQEGSVGKQGFVAAHSWWGDEEIEAASRIESEIKRLNLRTIRVAWGDQHGIVRGKNVMAHDFLLALKNGIDFQTATLFFDTTNHMFAPMFSGDAGIGMEALAGGPDAILVPDPTTFRTLPWAPNTGWILSEMYLSSGEPCPFDSRGLMRRTLKKLSNRGFHYLAGLEVEFYITRLKDPMHSPEQSGWPPDPPIVDVIAHGFQYLTEERQDEIDPILQVLQDNIEGLGLPLRTMEDEWGPGQCEFTFDPTLGLVSADNMLLFRTAVKQICRRNGLHATFMTRPGLPNFFSSGWHLHQSLCDTKSGENMFTNNSRSKEPLSLLGKQFMAGILKHTPAACVFSTPTINGYKRYAPQSFAPTKITWASENRGALIRVLGGPGDSATHIENRAGEPCANPYLYMASQIIAGIDGMDNALNPGPADASPYESNKPLLPRTLMEAVAELNDNQLFRTEFGDDFVNYFLALKQSEIDRFQAYVTDWEHREYFEVF